LGQEIRITNKILRHRGMICESHDEAEVAVSIQCLVKKCARGVLLEPEARGQGTASVDRYTHAQRQF
jgi:hypothetical protein